MANYKRDWTGRKPYYILKQKTGYLVIINERKLVTETPYADLIASLEEMIASIKEAHATCSVP